MIPKRLQPSIISDELLSLSSNRANWLDSSSSITSTSFTAPGRTITSILKSTGTTSKRNKHKKRPAGDAEKESDGGASRKEKIERSTEKCMIK